MSELQNVQLMLEEAKRAANAGDLASAEARLQDAARIQEAELGPLHPELANTVNNLGIVAEMQGRVPDAETCYRRAVAITSASLPPDDPRVASSRKNLEDFAASAGCPSNLQPRRLRSSAPSTDRRWTRLSQRAKRKVLRTSRWRMSSCRLRRQCPIRGPSPIQQRTRLTERLAALLRRGDRF